MDTRILVIATEVRRHRPAIERWRDTSENTTTKRRAASVPGPNLALQHAERMRRLSDASRRRVTNKSSKPPRLPEASRTDTYTDPRSTIELRAAPHVRLLGATHKEKVRSTPPRSVEHGPMDAEFSAREPQWPVSMISPHKPAFKGVALELYF